MDYSAYRTKLLASVDFELKHIRLVGDISEDTYYMVTNALDEFEKMFNNRSNPEDFIVNIFINSSGGEIYSGLGIIDSIMRRKFQVHTICEGKAMSMAAWILACGDTRYATKNSYIMIHDGQFALEGSATQLKIEQKHHDELEKRCWKLLADASKKTPGGWEKLAENGNIYLTATQAKAKGLVDEIL